MSKPENPSLFGQKLALLRALLERRGLSALRLAQQKNVSWLLGGRSHVNTASEPACCQFVLTAGDCWLVVNNIEADRVLAEEADEGLAAAAKPLVWPWTDPSRREALVREALNGRHVAGDGELEEELLRLRTTVLPAELGEWRRLGRLTADALAETAREMRRGQSEHAVAGLLALKCRERGLEPIVNLIAADERAFSRRHPLPTGRAVDRYAMLVVCARSQGRIASATRLVHFGPAPADLRARHRAVAEIDARAIAASRPGATLGELYDQFVGFYRDAGYPGEIMHHHQGGLTGYATREQLALPGDPFPLADSQLLAWNPSVAGAKSEDTILISHTGAPEILTLPEDGDFPVLEVKANGRIWRRPDVLVR